VGVATVVGVAGCTDDGDEDGGTVPGEDYPTIDEWLTETDVGDADDTYDGALLDRRDEDSVTIETGVSGNSGNFAFGPSAALVSTETNVEWSWTGQGNPHNVEAIPAEQLGRSDYEFSSGEPESGSGVNFTYTVADAGLALYHCEPHLSLGMKGGIAVES